MVSILVSKAVDSGFISGVMASVLASKGVDRGFICGMMVNITNEPTIYTFKDKYANHYATDEPMIYRF
jgi:hypothetical protein